eukprot:3381360-Pleurochrysis_carterae.AAC.1
MGRISVSWRGAVGGWSSYDLTEQLRGSKAQKTIHQSYSSLAVQQLLMKAAFTEEIWHDNANFCTPEKLRLQRHLRTRKLKCEMADDL